MIETIDEGLIMLYRALDEVGKKLMSNPTNKSIINMSVSLKILRNCENFIDEMKRLNLKTTLYTKHSRYTGDYSVVYIAAYYKNKKRPNRKENCKFYMYLVDACVEPIQCSTNLVKSVYKHYEV